MLYRADLMRRIQIKTQSMLLFANTYKIKYFFSSPSYYAWGTLVIVQISDFRLLVDLHVLGSAELKKKHKISMVSGCSLVSVCVSMLVCGDDIS